MSNNMQQAPMQQATELYTLQLPSTPSSITLLENLIEEVADKYRISDDTFANMMTCLNEVVNNAIIHGNKLNVNKKVIINLEIDPKRALWTITDQGEGFDYTNLADPTTAENLENLTGRGVFIIKQLADQCVFNAAGNEVELLFKI
jgi:serine/threonine-protein kinase RsbW